MIKLAAGTNLLLSEALLRKLKELKDELGGEARSPLDRLLASRVAATWLQVTYYEALIAQAAGSSESRQKMLQQNLDGAHRRHLASIKTLATVKKLLAPSPSPLQIATRLDGHPGAARRGRAEIAGSVGLHN